MVILVMVQLNILLSLYFSGYQIVFSAFENGGCRGEKEKQEISREHSVPHPGPPLL